MAVIKHEPKYGRVLIKREVKKEGKFGIIIPESATKRHAKCEGIIEGLGETAGWTETYIEGELKPIQTLKIGDRVLFGRHAGTWLDATYDKQGEQNDDGSLFICQDADILTVIREGI